MKRIFLFAFAAMVAFGCEDQAKPNACGLELTLVKMASSWTGDQSTDDDLPWQETILLWNDSSFLKRRTYADSVSEAVGRYAYVTLDNRQYVELTYTPGEDNIRASCSPTEFIEVKSSTQFENTEWQACDGPILDYKAHTSHCSE
ncbi:hypothetical protein KK062_09130 [Fulvivirgaceae bacterium PWU5]|uniref:Lipoprotein n=1 Tax=Dawidia cretensis TaxID=2782350 RepID=A0AAP2GP94_9BACT|nr:hypothetical protein [Dawidia cretensis]MBT1708386.1 hypothetical protein [Dawidia cretensis]